MAASGSHSLLRVISKCAAHTGRGEKFLNEPASENFF